MAAPTPTVRQTPAGIRLKNGYKTLITFASNPDLAIFEVNVTPSGWSGGEPINTSTMHNDEIDTQSPRALRKGTPCTVQCAYDPMAFPDIEALINEPDTITERSPNGDTVCYFGYLQNAEKGPHVNGTMPLATLTIIPTHEDANGVEQPPVYAGTAGTGG